MTDDKPSTATVHIVRRSLTFDDGPTGAPTAVCPRRLTLIAVERCRRCPHFAGLVIKPDEQAHLRCAFELSRPGEPSISFGCAADAMTPSYASERMDIARQPAFSVGPDAPVGYVAAIMAQEQVEHVLVVEDEAVIGSISLRDLARWLACRAGYVVPSRNGS